MKQVILIFIFFAAHFVQAQFQKKTTPPRQPMVTRASPGTPASSTTNSSTTNSSTTNSGQGNTTSSRTLPGNSLGRMAAVSPAVLSSYQWWKTINPTGVIYISSFSNVSPSNFDTGAVAFSKKTVISLVGWINRNVNMQQAESDDSLVHLEPLIYLEQLELPWQTGDAGLQHIRNLRSLKYFGYAVSGTPCPNVTDNGMAILAGLTKLETVSLNYCTRITDQGLRQLCGLPNLKTLILSFSAITDNGLPYLNASTHLQILNIAKSSAITDNGVGALITAIKSMPNFQKLIISGTQISVTGRQKLTAAGISFVY